MRRSESAACESRAGARPHDRRLLAETSTRSAVVAWLGHGARAVARPSIRSRRSVAIADVTAAVARFARTSIARWISELVLTLEHTASARRRSANMLHRHQRRRRVERRDADDELADDRQGDHVGACAIRRRAKKNMDIDWRFHRGDVVKIRIFNDPSTSHAMAHPIHLHGQRFLVLTRDGVRSDNLVWKDTAIIPAGETVELLVDMSNPGPLDDALSHRRASERGHDGGVRRRVGHGYPTHSQEKGNASNRPSHRRARDQRAAAARRRRRVARAGARSRVRCRPRIASTSPSTRPSSRSCTSN